MSEVNVPRVSICVSVLNDAQMLAGTLKSIVAQTFTDWEAIVVDDGSDDPQAVVDVCAGFNDPRIILHRFEVNRGIPHGANFAYKLARGDFIGSLGVDEQIPDTKLEDQVAYLDANPGIDLIWGIPGHGQTGRRPEWEQYVLRAHNRSREHWIKCFVNLEGVPVGGASALWRRKVFDSVGYFNENLTAFSDHEWFCRVIEKHEVRILPYRWMTQLPGKNIISTRTEANSAKLDAEYEYVKRAHPLLLPPVSGLITVAVPTFNHGKYLGTSLAALFAQTEQHFECIIMDDASEDAAEVDAAVAQYLSDARVTFVRSPENCGHMATVNKMLAMAKGTFFVSYSADDTMSPDFLAKCLAEFRRDPFLEYVASQNDFMHEDGKPWPADEAIKHPFHTIAKAFNRTQAEWYETFRYGNVYFGIGMYRTQALRDVGGWEPKHGVISDYQMYLKLLPRYNFKVIEEPLTHTRIHGKNQSLLSGEEAKKLRRLYHDAKVPFYQPRPKVIIATPFYNLHGFEPYITALVATTKLMTMAGINWEFMPLSGDSYVHRARNSMCMRFLLDPDATDLFFIDSDEAWDPQGFMNMLFLPHPLVGAAYPVKNKWELWTSKPAIADAATDPHFEGINLPDGGALIKATQLAGGFLRIKRSLLEKFIDHYPTLRYKDTHPVPEERVEQVEFFAAGTQREQEIVLLNEISERMKKANGSGVDLHDLQEHFDKLKEIRDFVGEDYTFSNRVRDMGVDIFIYPNVTIAHYGLNEWKGNFDEYLKRKSAEEKAESVAASQVLQ